ncbi:hypothetical protein [Mucilaginibacter defluvii]|uniref:Uncharacterized protein n=1 Tax=Mucilaginibacter defluvii TaxID=1196019 RepID=A0ABP9FP45_9SPHI
MTGKKSDGAGISIPPIKEHVVIYFIQHGKPENYAINFFDHFASNQWRNSRGSVIKNWKWCAWDWIYQKVVNK